MENPIEFDVCRLCKKDSKNFKLFDIFSKPPFKFEGELNVHIYTFTSVKITENDLITKKICIDCIDLIEKMCNLKKKSIIVNAELLKEYEIKRPSVIKKNEAVFNRKRKIKDETFESKSKKLCEEPQNNENFRFNSSKINAKSSQNKCNLTNIEKEILDCYVNLGLKNENNKNQSDKYVINDSEAVSNKKNSLDEISIKNCDNIFNLDSESEEEEKVESKSFKRVIGYKQFVEKSILKPNEKSVNQSIPRCNFCLQKFDSKQALSNHFKVCVFKKEETRVDLVNFQIPVKFNDVLINQIKIEDCSKIVIEYGQNKHTEKRCLDSKATNLLKKLTKDTEISYEPFIKKLFILGDNPKQSQLLNDIYKTYYQFFTTTNFIKKRNFYTMGKKKIANILKTDNKPNELELRRLKFLLKFSLNSKIIFDKEEFALFDDLIKVVDSPSKHLVKNDSVQTLNKDNNKENNSPEIILIDNLEEVDNKVKEAINDKEQSEKSNNNFSLNKKKDDLLINSNFINGKDNANSKNKLQVKYMDSEILYSLSSSQLVSLYNLFKAPPDGMTQKIFDNVKLIDEKNINLSIKYTDIEACVKIKERKVVINQINQDAKSLSFYFINKISDNNERKLDDAENMLFFNIATINKNLTHPDAPKIDENLAKCFKKYFKHKKENNTIIKVAETSDLNLSISTKLKQIINNSQKNEDQTTFSSLSTTINQNTMPNTIQTVASINSLTATTNSSEHTKEVKKDNNMKVQTLNNKNVIQTKITEHSNSILNTKLINEHNISNPLSLLVNKNNIIIIQPPLENNIRTPTSTNCSNITKSKQVKIINTFPRSIQNSTLQNSSSKLIIVSSPHGPKTVNTNTITSTSFKNIPNKSNQLKIQTNMAVLKATANPINSNVIHDGSNTPSYHLMAPQQNLTDSTFKPKSININNVQNTASINMQQPTNSLIQMNSLNLINQNRIYKPHVSALSGSLSTLNNVAKESSSQFTLKSNRIANNVFDNLNILPSQTSKENTLNKSPLRTYSNVPKIVNKKTKIQFSKPSTVSQDNKNVLKRNQLANANKNLIANNPMPTKISTSENISNLNAHPISNNILNGSAPTNNSKLNNTSNCSIPYITIKTPVIINSSIDNNRTNEIHLPLASTSNENVSQEYLNFQNQDQDDLGIIVDCFSLANDANDSQLPIENCNNDDIINKNKNVQISKIKVRSISSINALAQI